MNRKWVFLQMILLLALVGCTRVTKSAEKDALFVSGRIDGDTVDISPKREGKIIEITVREGDTVTAGQVVARIVSPQDEAQVDAQKANVIEGERKLEEAVAAGPARVALAEANLAASRAELVRWQAEVQQAELDAKRYPPLVESGAAAEQTGDQQKTKLKIALASTDASRKQVLAAEASLDQAKAQLQQIATAKANLASSRAQLRRFEANVSDLTITAPIAGTILTRSAEPGRVIAAGQTILTMVDLSKLYLRGFVPEGDVGKVKVGQQAKVFLDSNPKEAVPAKVIRIDPQAMFTPENTYFKDDRVKQVMGVKLGIDRAPPAMPNRGCRRTEHIQIGKYSHGRGTVVVDIPAPSQELWLHSRLSMRSISMCSPGEIFGFIGADGAGKTTAFRIIGGVLEPGGGEIRVLGQDASRGAPQRGISHATLQPLSWISAWTKILTTRAACAKSLRTISQQRREHYFKLFDMDRTSPIGLRGG